jgi:hypothetical protein
MLQAGWSRVSFSMSLNFSFDLLLLPAALWPWGRRSLLIFLIGIMGKGGGVQLGPLSTAAANRPILPASGDYDDGEIDGMMIGRGNRSTRRKPAPVPLCPPQPPHACPDANPGRSGGKLTA